MINFRSSMNKLYKTEKNIIIYVLTFACMFGIIIFLYAIFENDDIVEKDINHTGDAEDIKDNLSSHSSGLKYNKKYLLVGVKRDNKYIMEDAIATIIFNENGTCLPSFDEMNQQVALPINYYLFVKYDDSITDKSCSYTIDDNSIIRINWLGLYHYSSGYSYNYSQSTPVDSGLIMNEAQFKYYPEKDVIDVYNGKWDFSFNGNEGYGVYIIKYVKDD